MKRVMFVCKKNSRRSQMAEGFARTLGAGMIEVASSGLEASKVDPKAVEVMAEIGIDISNQTSKPLNDFNSDDYDAVISLCGCGVNLPEAWVLREIFTQVHVNGHSTRVLVKLRKQISNRLTKN